MAGTHLKIPHSDYLSMKNLHSASVVPCTKRLAQCDQWAMYSTVEARKKSSNCFLTIMKRYLCSLTLFKKVCIVFLDCLNCARPRIYFRARLLHAVRARQVLFIQALLQDHSATALLLLLAVYFFTQPQGS